jgi:nucleoside-diphosphate-sugar epimerase
VPVAAMVRPGKGPATLAGILGHWEQEAGRSLPRPVVIEGDLCLDEVVPDAEQRRWLNAHCDRILSCAASMTFREDKRGEPFRTNIDGTRNLLALCRQSGIRQFHQVSTAYICGLRQGQILETDVDVGQTLGNVYEKSKLEAEKMIRAADFLDQRTFYRPASVVGDSRSGYVTSFHGYYLPLQLAHAMAGRVPVKEMNERFFAKLGLEGHEGKNLVPVEWLSQAIAYLVTHPEHHGRTYHLASHAPVPVSEIQKVVRDAIERYYPRPLATSISDAELTAIEGLFYEYMSIYRSHWRDDPKFDLTNTRRALAHLPCPELTYDALLRVSRYPVERNFIAPRHEVPTPDYDAAAHVEGLSASASVSEDEAIGLQVNGAGGGQWQLQLTGGEVAAVDRGLPSRPVATFYLSATTFGHLAQGELSVDAAVNSGRLVVHGDKRRLGELIGAFEQIVSGRTSGQVATHVMN